MKREPLTVLMFRCVTFFDMVSEGELLVSRYVSFFDTVSGGELNTFHQEVLLLVSTSITHPWGSKPSSLYTYNCKLYNMKT